MEGLGTLGKAQEGKRGPAEAGTGGATSFEQLLIALRCVPKSRRAEEGREPRGPIKGLGGKRKQKHNVYGGDKQ